MELPAVTPGDDQPDCCISTITHVPVIMEEPLGGKADLELTAPPTPIRAPETTEESATVSQHDSVMITTIQPPGTCLLPVETPEITSGEELPNCSDDVLLPSIQYKEHETPANQQSSPISKPEQNTIKPSTPAKGLQSSFTAPEGSYNKDVLITELKAMKMAAIQARNASLEAEISRKRAKLEEVTKGLDNPAAETVQRHIKLLHDYNDIRDVGQGLVGMIADNRGVRIGELYEEFGVGLKD